MKYEMTGAVVNTYRAGVVLGISVLLFMQREYVNHREFSEYKLAHQVWGDEVVKRIDGRLDRIERKLDHRISYGVFGLQWPYTNNILKSD